MIWARTRGLRWWLVWVMVCVLVISLTSFLVTLDTLPGNIVIATAKPTGQYFNFGNEFRDALLNQAGRDVVVKETDGSIHNRELLLAGEVDLAIIQTGSVSLNEIAVVAPLHRDVVFVIARKDSGVRSVTDLEGKNVIIGPTKSGMRSSAQDVLLHYGLQDRVNDQGDVTFDKIDEAGYEHVHAAIVTTGLDNKDLRQLLTAPSDYELLPINARAIAAEKSYFQEYYLPKGFFSEGPPVPANEIATVTTMAVLAVREDAPSRLVEASLDALYKEDFQAEFPYLMSHEEAANLPPVRLHPVARRYFDPFDQIGWMAAIVESLAATKELVFAVGAGLFLCWDHWRRRRQKKRAELIRIQKERVDALMERTLDIERRQMAATDLQLLRDLLDEVTKTKLHALKELTLDDLRADQSFSIFLMQCANLINKIQLKIITYTNLRDMDTSTPASS